MTRLRKDLEYQRVGFWSWFFRRLTGLGIVAYLLLHIVVIHSLVYGPATFNQAMRVLSSPAFKLGELVLIGAIFIHGFDGLRIIIVDFFGGARYERRLLWVLGTLGTIGLIGTGLPLLLHLLGA